jgi:hypothetical protein
MNRLSTRLALRRPTMNSVDPPPMSMTRRRSALLACPLDHPEEDQPPFFLAADHVDRDPDDLLDPLQEHASALCAAYAAYWCRPRARSRAGHCAAAAQYVARLSSARVHDRLAQPGCPHSRPCARRTMSLRRSSVTMRPPRQPPDQQVKAVGAEVEDGTDGTGRSRSCEVFPWRRALRSVIKLSTGALRSHDCAIADAGRQFNRCRRIFNC